MKMIKEKLQIDISTGTLVRIALFGVLLLALFKLKDLLLVVLTSIVIASFVETGITQFRKIKIGRTFAVVCIYIITFLMLAVLFYLLAPTFFRETTNLISLISGYLPEDNFLSQADSPTLNSIAEIITTFSLDISAFSSIGSFFSRISSGFFQTFSVLFGGVVNFILIIIISFYLSMQEKGIEHFLRIVTPLKHEGYVVGLWERVRKKISLWVQGQLLLAVIIGVLTFVGLSLLGVEYAFFLALITAIFELIPFGIILAIIPAISFGFVEGGLQLAVMVGGLYILIQQLENYIISPLIVNRVVGISPLVVILSVLVGAKLAGFWGLILAIPVAVLLLEFVSDVERKSMSEDTSPNSPRAKSLVYEDSLQSPLQKTEK